MKFSIITPAHNARLDLPRCVASVRDQDGVSIEHIVIDDGSTDGTDAVVAALAEDTPAYRLRCWRQPNQGMYAALNAGLERATGDWVGFLNADDQYVEGALARVAAAARGRPEVEVWYGDLLVVDADGRLLAWRKSIPPHWWLIAGTDLYIPSSAVFIRRDRIERGLRFDPSLRTAGDEAFVVALLRGGTRWAHIAHPLSVFTWTAQNLSRTPEAHAETTRLKRTYPLWVRWDGGLWKIVRVALKIGQGAWRPPRPLDYAVYTKADATRRTRFVVDRPPWRWPKGER